MPKYSNTYSIDWDKLAEWFLPHFLRSERMIAWVKIVLSSFKSLYISKEAWRAQERYKATHNGQVVYLEKVLNEQYGVAGYDPDDHVNTRTIFIDEGDELDGVYIYKEADNKPLFIGGASSVYIYSSAEYDARYSDFIVKVPTSITFNENEMRALVNYYLNTKTYKIETYS